MATPMSVSVGGRSCQMRSICATCGRHAQHITAPTRRGKHLPGTCAHRPHKGRVSLRTTADIEAETSSQEQAETYDWFKHWWPVQFVDNLEDDRPNRIQLLGEYFGAWKGKSGEWIVMRDMCPHRLAPLSEGRIEDDGTLMCSYHGWRFNESGKCVRIPQADDEKSHEAACSNARSCAQTLRSKVHACMLWIWPDKDSTDEADSTELPIPDEYAVALQKSADRGIHVNYTRVVPYSFDVLMENLMDPAHFPFSHHGTMMGTRDMAKPIGMRSEHFLFPNSLASAVFETLGGYSPGQLEVQVPNVIWQQYGIFGEGNAWRRDMLFAVPVDRNKTRFLTQGVSPAILNGNQGPSLFLLMNRFVPWLFHLKIHDILDGDNVFLSIQDRHLEEKGKGNWRPSDYYTPTSADMVVVAYRKWLAAVGGGGPMNGGGHGNPLSKRELLDRYESHVVDCKVCQRGLRLMRRVMTISKLLAQASLAVAAMLLFKSYHNGLVYWKTALPLIGFSMFAFVSKYIKDKVIPQFYFVDYVHAEKN